MTDQRETDLAHFAALWNINPNDPQCQRAADGCAHGRADLEARCQQARTEAIREVWRDILDLDPSDPGADVKRCEEAAQRLYAQARADALRDAAHLLRCAMSLHGVAAGSVALATLDFLTASPTTVFVSPAGTVEAMRPATTVAGALKPVAFVQREPAPAPARVAPVDEARRLLGELVAGIDSFQDDADNGIADDMRRVTTMNAALEAARACLAAQPPSTAPAEHRDATAADVKAALERKHPECRVLEDPVLQDSGLWVALVALTPWGPLVRVEAGVVPDAQVSAAVAREKAGAT